MSEEIVLYDVRDQVAVITLSRPDRLNAWTPAMQTRYFDLLEQATADAQVRAIVLTGAGRGFCAGADMAGLSNLAAGEGPRDGRADTRPITFTMTIPKPVIAAINGACAGIGLSVAMTCDLRFAASGAKFTTAFVRRGLIAEHGLSWLLPHIVGRARALDLLLSGRVVLAEEALAMGLVNAVHPANEVLDATLEYARDLAINCSPTSMAVIKAQLASHSLKDLATALHESNGLMLESLQRPDFGEGVKSYMEKRTPAFAPAAGAGPR
jgi:enoyl-CoA hydratase/carnithine racemase